MRLVVNCELSSQYQRISLLYCGFFGRLNVLPSKIRGIEKGQIVRRKLISQSIKIVLLLRLRTGKAPEEPQSNPR